MKKTAFLFPGQGSQKVGMGQDLYQEFDFVREVFDMAEEIAQINISRLCFKGPMEDLTATINLQPAVTTVNLSCLAALAKEGVQPDLTAGHSLGEYSALCASGIISQPDAIRLVLKRGRLMHREATRHQGAMHAIIGLPIDRVEQLVADVQPEGVVAVANHNAELQIVITGDPESVTKVASLATAQGARAIPLKVSGAWHSQLIAGAEEEFKSFLSGFTFAPPVSPILLNVTGDFADDPAEIRSLMGQQLCNPVKWYDTMCKLIEGNVENFVEIGPGKVLAGLLKKIVTKEVPHTIYNVSDMPSLDKFLHAVT